jgi:putative phosphoribosyl transferase
MRFANRADAGRALAEHLRAYAGRSDVVVLALPRGGVEVGFELARELAVALDVYLVRKLGVPGREELAMGAIASDGTRVLNTAIVARLGITDEAIARTAILVDDGLATGASMRVAALALRARRPERLVIAVPVAPRDVCEMLRMLVDEVVCAEARDRFRSVGEAYDDFPQTSDDEVCELLARAPGSRTHSSSTPG